MSEITISTFDLQNYQGGGASAAIRIFALKTFLTSDNELINKQRPGGPVWYKSISCTVVGTVITVPQFTIDSTTDSDVPTAGYTAMLYDSNSNFKDFLFKNYAVPASLGTPITYAQLRTYNNAADQSSDLPTLETLLSSILPSAVRSTVLTGLSTASAAVIAATDTVLTAFGRLQAQITAESQARALMFPRSVLTANVNYTSNDVPANTDLSVTVEVDKTYRLRCIIHTSGGAGNFRCDLDGGTATMKHVEIQYRSYNTAGVVDTGGRGAALSTDFVTGVTSAVILIDGEIVINDAGTIIFRAAQGTPDGSASTLRRGSTIELLKMD